MADQARKWVERPEPVECPSNWVAPVADNGFLRLAFLCPVNGTASAAEGFADADRGAISPSIVSKRPHEFLCRSRPDNKNLQAHVSDNQKRWVRALVERKKHEHGYGGDWAALFRDHATADPCTEGQPAVLGPNELAKLLHAANPEAGLSAQTLVEANKILSIPNNTMLGTIFGAIGVGSIGTMDYQQFVKAFRDS